MQIFLRRLYNGGFNHLKSTSFLVQRAPRTVIPASARFCTTDSQESNGQFSVLSNLAQDSSADDKPQRERERLTRTAMSEDFVKANEQYLAGFGEKGSLPILPAKKLAVVTCMDARINMFSQLGIKEGDAHIIRNAGGVARDALRSLIISQRLLGTREIAIIHHTSCGMVSFQTPQLRALVKESDPSNPALSAVDEIDFLEFANLEQSVKDDVGWLKENPLVLPESQITGWVYEVETGKLRQVI